MKVCTDACLFGALVAQTISDGLPTVKNILDIGTGTGLLSLMLAQKTNASIDGLEIDSNACQQAKQNFQQSPWNNKLNAINTDVLLFETGKKYDCIISNPPFFEGDLKSPDKKRNAAMHGNTLNLEQLLTVSQKLLLPDGFFAVLLPFHRTDYFEELAESFNFFTLKKILVKQTAKHNYFRSILLVTDKKCTAEINELTIKSGNEKYSDDFIYLLKDYYLNL